jgi:hypothetical protein
VNSCAISSSILAQLRIISASRTSRSCQRLQRLQLPLLPSAFRHGSPV